MTIEPRRPGSLRLEEVDDVADAGGCVVVRTLAIGVCATDRELMAGMQRHGLAAERWADRGWLERIITRRVGLAAGTCL